MIKCLKNAKYIEGFNKRQRPYGCAHLQKRQLFSQRLHKYSGVVEGMAFRRVRPARAYTTLVMLVYFVMQCYHIYNIGFAIEEAFRGQISTKIGNVEINSEILQDDIANLNDNVSKARVACEKINDALSRKQLSLNYNKSKYMIIGSKNKKDREKILREIKENPMRMGNSIIENSQEEKYLGDEISEDGCVASISETIKERIRKLTSKGHDIIQICESPIMGGLGNSLAPFKLFNATVVESLLTNCQSWIGLNKSHINLLQNFQDGFIRSALKLADSIPKALLTWDIGLMPMKWRIAQKKLLFLNKLMKRDISNLAKQVVYEEVITGTKGLAHECSQICDEIGIQDIMCVETTEQYIKNYETYNRSERKQIFASNNKFQ